MVITERASPTKSTFSPWKDPVSTPYKIIVSRHKTTGRDVEMHGESEPTIYRAIDLCLNYQALSQSEKISSTGRYLSIGPQGPIFSHGKPSPAVIDLSGSKFLFAYSLSHITVSHPALLPSIVAQHVKSTPRTRASVQLRDDDPDSSSSGRSSYPSREYVYDQNSAHFLSTTFRSLSYAFL